MTETELPEPIAGDQLDRDDRLRPGFVDAVLDAVDVPVVAAGGIATARGVAAEVGGTAVRCDVTDPADSEAAVAHAEAEHGGLDVVLLNAGVAGGFASWDDLDLDRYRQMTAVNVDGVVFGLRAALPALRRRGGGSVVVTASLAGLAPAPATPVYALSKAAVVQFTRVLASELGPYEITVNAYAPGMVPTAMNGFADLPAEQADRLLDTLSLRRWESADDVANLLIFLASDAAGYITGTLHDVSGGKLATQIPSRAHR